MSRGTVDHLHEFAGLMGSMIVNDARKVRRYRQAARRPYQRYDPAIMDRARALRTDGLVVIPDFLPREVCAEWARQVEELVPPRPALLGQLPDRRLPYTVSTASRTVPLADGAMAEFRRIETPGAEDSGVICLYHVDRLVPGLRDLRSDPRLAGIVHAACGEELPSRAFKAFIHDSVTNTQGFHVDNDGELCFKAFIALTDVTEPADGAHAYLRGSHLASMVKYRNLLHNGVRPGRYLRTIERAPRSQAVNVLCRAGSVFIVDVNGIHRALPQAEGRRRIVLVNCFDRSGYPINHDPPLAVRVVD